MTCALACAQVADFLGTKHHELHFTVQEGLDCLHDLIYHLESFEQVPPAFHSVPAIAFPCAALTFQLAWHAWSTLHGHKDLSCLPVRAPHGALEMTPACQA